MLKLHYAPKTISMVAMLALEEARVKYTPVLVDFASLEQTKEAYLQINPKARVPALETPMGILTETPAIIEFVAPALIPTDLFTAARMREVIAYLASTMHVNHAHRMRGHRWADQQSSFGDMAQKVPQTMAASAAYLESHCDLSPFVLGGQMTLADLYLYPVLTWLHGDGVDIADYPKLAGFAGTMAQRPSVKRLTEEGLL